METPVVDLTKIVTREHERKWIALSRDNTRVVDFDVDLGSLDKRVNKDEVTYMKVPPSDVYLNF